MATSSKSKIERSEKVPSPKKTPQSLAIAAVGINTSTEFAQLMSALMSDLIAGSIAPQIGNAVCNAGGKLLKVVEMQLKYGTANPSGGKSLKLVESGK